MTGPWVIRNDPAEWNERVSPESADHFIADCGSAESHRIRLEAVLRIPVVDGDTIVELGCGTGALADLLPGGARYIGFDFSERVVEEARARRPGADFRLGGAESLVAAEWLVANGPFSYSEGWSRAQTYETVRAMWDLSTKGVSITFLTASSPDVPRLHYTAGEVFGLVEEWEFAHAELDRSYLPNDMCLRAWRAPAIR